MALRAIEGPSDVPYFYRILEDNCSGNWQQKIPNIKAVLEDIFMVSAERGLNDEELSLLLLFFSKGPISDTVRAKLLRTMVPTTRAPSEAVKTFMFWFVSNYHKKKFNRVYAYALQWIIGLLENDLVDPSVIDIFYYDFYTMLQYKVLVKYACKLLCQLTKPCDVTPNVVRLVKNKLENSGDNDDKFLQAVLNVFKGFRPQLMPEDVKWIDVNKVLRTVPQSMDILMKVMVNRKRKQPISRDLGVFEETTPCTRLITEDMQKVCSLMPFPWYNLQGMDKMIAVYPNSVKEAFKCFSSVPIPQNVLSLLRDNIGFFLIMYKGIEVQKRFSARLLRTLQGALINQEIAASEEDMDFLLSRVYELQMFMQQGLPCVSLFLAGYLLTWDGLDHRSLILALIEWASFHSFQGLSTNVLRPLFMLFVSNNVNMKTQIIQTATNLIRNMLMTDVNRVVRGLPHPFFKKAPDWTSQPLSMISPLIDWTEQLVKLGLCLEPKNSVLLMQSVHFYEVMTLVESRHQIPSWTVVSRGVVYHSLFNVAPVALNSVCRLLLRYHTEFLPQLRRVQPEFYNHCSDKIHLTTKYIQEIMNFLWNGQALTRKEDGVIFKEMSERELEKLSQQMDLDHPLNIDNVNFMPYMVLERQKNGPNFIQKKEDFLVMLEFHLQDIAKFIKHFSPSA